MLRSQIRATDIDRLVLTKRYELLLSMIAGLTPEVSRTVDVHPARVFHVAPARQHAVVNDLLVTELEERTGAFDEACKALEQQIVRWSRSGMFVGLDTSVYLTHPDKLEELDIADLAGARGHDLHVLVPMVVIEELDGLKQRGDNQTRWRAAYTLAFLDKVLTRPTEPAQLRVADFSALQSGGIPRGEVSIELLFDPSRHVRLPVNDDEIIDRLLAARSLAARPITLITYDTSQSFKARAAGLRVNRLPMPIENEPEPVQKQRGGVRRKDRDRGAEREAGSSSP
jgi:hypothetical protein